MILRERDLIERALEEGLRYGMMRSYKYDDAPRHGEDWTEDQFAALVQHLMAALDEIVAEWGGDAIQDPGPDLK